MKYLFQLGHQPHISRAELDAVSSKLKIPFEIIRQSNAYLIVESGVPIESEKLLNRLGGIIKIGMQIKNVGDEVKSIAHFLRESTPGKIHFSVSGDNAKQIALNVKKDLKSEGLSIRYIEPKNTATILHNNLVVRKGDFTVVHTDVFVTEAIQDIENYTKRDYDRPGSDDISGMLPPKLAQIMINLSQASTKDILLDPFCGSGTILTEAMTQGFTHVIGSDKSEKAISDAKKNIEWLTKNYQLPRVNYQLLTTNVQSLHDKLKKESIDVIVTEPYLGKPLKGSETKQQLGNQAHELRELYTESFKNFYKLLKPSGTIIFVFPKFKCREEWVETIPLDHIKNSGFEVCPLTEQNPSLLYHRPKQHLGRDIWKFKKI